MSLRQQHTCTKQNKFHRVGLELSALKDELRAFPTFLDVVVAIYLTPYVSKILFVIKDIQNTFVFHVTGQYQVCSCDRTPIQKNV